jgi:hypothetical protein
MEHRTGKLRGGLSLLVSVAAALTLAACASSGGGNAGALLSQTFGGKHTITSGILAFDLTVNPSGSRTLTGPITLSFSGPFQSLGAGKLPESAFDVSISALGNSASVTITSTGTKGYVTFDGESYQLPQSTFQQLESAFAQLGSSPVSSNGSGLLGKLGIQPAHWLQNPQVVGSETIGGVPTTHIHAAINVTGFLSDLGTFLGRASSLGISGTASLPHGISAATRSRIAHEIQDPTFDVWTGQADKTIRRLEIGLTLPVSGTISTLLGGLRSAAIGLSMQYGSLNQPQTITAPTTLHPFSQFKAKLKTLIQEIQSGVGSTLGGGGLGGSGSSGSTASRSSGSSSSGTSSTLQKYSTCIQAANGDVAKMQRCAPLLNAG